MGCRAGVVLALVCLVAAGCATGPEWRARETASIGGFGAPECALVDPSSGAVYVSNIAISKGGAWADDGTGFISRLRPGGQPQAMRWKDSTSDLPLNAAKGMCVVGATLYVADNTRIVCYPTTRDEPGRRIEIPGAKQLNDMASDGAAAYVSDTATGRIYRIDPQASLREIKGPPSANGITFHKGRLFAVSWGMHEVYELDASGKEGPKPFGLAASFKNLDGIEVLEDGTFIVSDYTAGKVLAISPDRKTIRPILSCRTPADIGLDRDLGLLYVPALEANAVSVYKLEKK
jgi:DNA-binding beta-propeller fold protein YncE